VDATDEVRVVVFHREHFIARFDWIFNRVCPTGEEYVQSHAFGGNFDVPRVFNHDHRVGVRVEIVSVDDGFFDFAILGVGLVLFELHPGQTNVFSCKVHARCCFNVLLIALFTFKSC
jgi:hypothetical protein